MRLSYDYLLPIGIITSCVNGRFIILEEGRHTGLVQIHCLVIVPFTRLSLGCSQSHFTAVYTHLLNRSFHLRQLKGLTMHEPLLSTK